MKFLGGLFLGSLSVVCIRTGWKLHNFEGGVRFACGISVASSFVVGFLRGLEWDIRKRNLHREGRYR